YAVAVSRAAQPNRHDLYTATLPKRLPRFRLPLAGSERGPVIDLPGAVARAIEEGGFACQIDYQRDPPATLSANNQAWLNDLLVGPGVGRRAAAAAEQPSRDHCFGDDAIAAVARRLWERDGGPQGRDEEYWFRAIDHLKRGEPV